MMALRALLGLTLRFLRLSLPWRPSLLPWLSARLLLFPPLPLPYRPSLLPWLSARLLLFPPLPLPYLPSPQH
jgi:hypothetical protein